jgi:ParB-like chromosome segregation protein Spo0J
MALKALDKKWPGSKIEAAKVADLVPYARNARIHTPVHVDQIAASIREWGFTQPVLIDEENTILAGHGRVLAAQKLELEVVPVIVARGWTEAQKRAYVLADNRLTELSTWDMEMVHNELMGLIEDGFDLSLTGFTEDAIGGEVSTLEELQDMIGEGDDEDFWPKIIIRVPPEVKKEWDDLWATCTGATEHEKLQELMKRCLS